MTLLALVTLALYGTSLLLLWRRIRSGIQEQVSGNVSQPGKLSSRASLLICCWLAAVCHGWLLLAGMIRGHDLNLALGNLFSLLTLMTVVIFLFATITRRILNLGIFVIPLGLMGMLVGQYLTGKSLVIQDVPLALWWHLGIALFAFGVLCIAAAQALLLYVQERNLHSHRPGSVLPALPAIQTMEKNLFQLTLLGVILLTINLLTGMLSAWQVHGTTLAFNHHILLSFLAWLGFTGLLAGHRIYGWRGAVAARWTMAAFGLLVLSYFGTRFVTTVILA